MIHFVVGTRAQLLKLAPVMIECERRGLAWRWVYTAQHQDTIQETLATFGLPEPDYVVVAWDTEAKSIGRMSRWFARMLIGLPRSRRILAGRTGPGNVVVTHGDTFTTWLACLMGKLTRTRVLHVESGLRSFSIRHPFPEELNRLIAFRLSNDYACPGEWAVANLARYSGVKLDTQANTQVDTLRFGLAHAADVHVEQPDTPYVVASLHRYENIFDEARLRQIVAALTMIAEGYTVAFIRHPATELQLVKHGLSEVLETTPRICLYPRLAYLPFLKLVLGAEFVITDGGGNQEELSYLGKPTLILRNETERHEGIGSTGVLAGLGDESIRAFVDDHARYARPISLPDVSPSGIIVDFLEDQGYGQR